MKAMTVTEIWRMRFRKWLKKRVKSEAREILKDKQDP